MKKKIWNKVNTPSTRALGLYLRINPKNGYITISGEMCSKLNTPKVNFVQDEAKPENWFLEPTKDADGFDLRFKREGYGANGMIQSTSLCREILKSSKLPLLSTKFIVSDEIEKDAGYPIITKSAKQAA